MFNDLSKQLRPEPERHSSHDEREQAGSAASSDAGGNCHQNDDKDVALEALGVLIDDDVVDDLANEPGIEEIGAGGDEERDEGKDYHVQIWAGFGEETADRFAGAVFSLPRKFRCFSRFKI